MKAIKVHLAVSIIYGLIILYIFDGESITKKEKIFIVLGLLFINLMVLLWQDVDYN